MTTFPSPALLVGVGNMAGAMVEGWRRAGIDFSDAVAVRPSGRPVEGVRTVTAIPGDARPRFVLLGVKPQKLDEIASSLGPLVSEATTLVSILAGVELTSLGARFPAAGAILRAMPNLPASEGRGVVALIGEGGVDRDGLSALFGLLGHAHWARDEAEFAAIGALAGAGPAYVARFVAALAKAGEERGLAPELATRIALETVLGTAVMADARGESMESVARRVASPNGTTEAGLRVLDAEGALDRLVAATLAAAARRGVELAEAARLA